MIEVFCCSCCMFINVFISNLMIGAVKNLERLTPEFHTPITFTNEIKNRLKTNHPYPKQKLVHLIAHLPLNQLKET